MRIETGEKTGPRRVADRDVAVGLGKGDPGLNETTDMACPDLRMASESFNVVVEVIADDEEDVRPRFCDGPGGNRKEERKGEKTKQEAHGFRLAKVADQQRAVPERYPACSRVQARDPHSGA